MEQARSSSERRNPDDAAHWHAVLRHGSFSEQVEARAHLAAFYEQRGRLTESIDLLETNLGLGATDDWLYAQLLTLYRKRDVASSFVGGSVDRPGALPRDDAGNGLLTFPDPSAPIPLPKSPALVPVRAPAVRLSIPSDERVAGEGPPRRPAGEDPSRQPHRASGAATRTVIVGAAAGALGAALVIGVMLGNWRLIAVLVVTLILLAIRWLPKLGRAPVVASIAAIKLPAIGGLSILAVLAVVVWLDARVGVPAQSAESAEQSPQVRARDVGPSQDAAQIAPVSPVVSESLAARMPGTRTIDGLLIGAPSQVPGQGAVAAAASMRTTRSTDLVVVEAGGGGVWLRAAPGDGEQIKLLVNGAQLADLGERREAGGQRWRHVHDPRTGDGWIADAYVRDSASLRQAALAHRLQALRVGGRPISTETVGYLAAIQPRLQSAEGALQGVLSVTARGIERPSLLVDARWRAELGARIATLKDRARELQSVAPDPPELGDLAHTITAVGRDLAVASDELLAGIDALDPIRLSTAADRLDGVDQQLDQASSQLLIATVGR